MESAAIIIEFNPHLPRTSKVWSASSPAAAANVIDKRLEQARSDRRYIGETWEDVSEFLAFDGHMVLALHSQKEARQWLRDNRNTYFQGAGIWNEVYEEAFCNSWVKTKAALRS